MKAFDLTSDFAPICSSNRRHCIKDGITRRERFPTIPLPLRLRAFARAFCEALH
jgi:hypothetical protein